MPLIRDIPLSLKASEVLRRAGVKRHSEIKPEIKSLVLELLASVENTRLLEPAVAYTIYSITGISHRQLSLEGNVVLNGSLLPSLMPQAKELAVAVGTIGPRLEKQVIDYFDQNEPLRGMLLDSIGSAAVDSLAQEACKFIAGEAASRGYQVSSPVNPGMPGLPLTEQWRLLEMVPAGEIGVSLTSAGVMVPRKSTSMVMGLGLQMETWTPAEVCVHCSLKKTCHYRIQV